MFGAVDWFGTTPVKLEHLVFLFFKAVSFKVVGDKQQFFYVLERANRYNVAHYGSKLSVFAGTV